MIGLIRLLLRFLWLAIFVLGVRGAAQIVREGLDGVVDRIEEGEAGPAEQALVRLHEALHRRQAHRAADAAPGPLGEM
ncbi:MAG: hypothetical protein VW450_00155 [Chloroflexota bacterium]